MSRGGYAAEDPQPDTQGCLLIVGGSERLDKDLHLLRAFARLVDHVPGRRGLVLITAATGHPEMLGGEYQRLFRQLGWPKSDLFLPPLANREQAASNKTANLIREAAGIYMTGGDQVALVEVLADTPVGDAIRAAYQAGAAIGGTSAGATAMGDPMIARGGGSGELKQGMITMNPGLGLAGRGLVIDTHFGQRGRFPRLVAAIAEHPAALGIGIDENTAILLRPGSRRVEVLGSGVVYFIDSPADRPASHHRGGAIGVAPITLHILHAGQHYDLTTRQVASDVA